MKQIHDRLLKERNWKVPERRLHKFVKRHRGPGGGATKAGESSPARKTTQGVFKKLFQRKSPEPAAKSVGGGAKPAATVLTDQSPGRISAAASLESSVLPDPQDLDGVPSTIVTTTTTTAPTVSTGENQASAAAAADVAADADVNVADKDVAGGEDDNDDTESKPCFMLPCEGMSCNVL